MSLPIRGVGRVFATTKGLIPTLSSLHLLYFYIFIILQHMNFFKSINNAVNQLNTIGSYFDQGNFNYNNDPITDLIRKCTYAQEVKFTIQKSVRQVLHVYPQYRVDKIQFVESNQQKKFIEVKGQIVVQHKGKIPLFIMYPANFPKVPPFVRLVNSNPHQFSPSQYYLKVQSKSDSNSFILNDVLQEVKGWKPTHSVASIIIEANDLVRNNYPFQPLNIIPNQYPPSNQGWNNPGYNNPIYPNNYGKNYQTQPASYSQSNNSQNSGKQPPIPFKTTSSLNQILSKSQKLVTTQKEKLNTIKNKHTSVLPALQLLDVTKRSLQSECEILFSQNQSMTQFVNKSSQSQIRVLSNLVTPKDEVSQHILQLNSSIKARQDTIQMLESKFNEQVISLQDFLKHVRKMQEAKFQEKVILIKYIQKS